MPDVDWGVPVATLIPDRPGARMTSGTEKSECSSAAQPGEAWFSRISVCIFEFIPASKLFPISCTLVFPRIARKEHQDNLSHSDTQSQRPRKKRLGNGAWSSRERRDRSN
jgi:hypothetical protein